MDNPDRNMKGGLNSRKVCEGEWGAIRDRWEV